MVFQSGSRTVIALKRESVAGTAAGDTGGLVFRKTSSQGVMFDRTPIVDDEKRADGMKSMGRLGHNVVGGTLNANVTVGGAIDSLIEAMLRTTVTAPLVITQATASLASITTTTSTIVASAGSWITAGVKVGDVARLTGHATAANNDLNLRIVTVTALTLTLAGTPLTADASPDSSFTLTVLKKYATGATPTRYAYSIEKNFTDIDEGELLLGNRLIGMTLTLAPGQMAKVSFTFMGMDQTQLTNGTSPYFTTPTVTTGLGLIADDSNIRFNGVEVAKFTGCTLVFGIDAEAIAVLGNNFVPADVIDNDLTLKGSITGLRSSLANMTLYKAETEFSAHILLQAPGTAPRDCLGVYIPRCKIEKLSDSGAGGDGAQIETLELMTAPKVATTTDDGSLANFYSSAA